MDLITTMDIMDTILTMATTVTIMDITTTTPDIMQSMAMKFTLDTFKFLLLQLQVTNS